MKSDVKDRRLVMVELFAGTGVMAKAFRDAGFSTFTIDNNPDLEPDLVADILTLKVEDLPEEFRHPDVVWASPPCTAFSVASIGRYWKDGKPKKAETYLGIALVLKAQELIKQLRPKYWFIENPRGMMRKMPFMPNHFRRTVTYCQYGLKYQKPTDIWTNAASWISRKPCRAGDSCHEYQPRTYQRKISRGVLGLGVQGLKDAKERGKLPEQLCHEVVNFCLGRSKVIQEILIEGDGQ